jgi:hypothetical protein
MEDPSYMRYIVDRNVVMRSIHVLWNRGPVWGTLSSTVRAPHWLRSTLHTHIATVGHFYRVTRGLGHTKCVCSIGCGHTPNQHMEFCREGVLITTRSLVMTLIFRSVLHLHFSRTGSPIKNNNSKLTITWTENKHYILLWHRIIC